MSRKMKLLLMGVGAAALIATPALTRMVHKQASAANQALGAGGNVNASGAGQNTRVQRHGILICGATFATDCENMEMLLQSGD